MTSTVESPPRNEERPARTERPSWTESLTGQPVLTMAEVSLCLVTLALVLNIGRLFIDNAYLPKLAVTAVAAHVLAAVRRRVSMPPVVSILLPIVGGVVLLTALHYPSQSTLGLPNGQVISALRTDMADAFGPFRTLVAPVPLTVGFAVALGAAIWVVGQFADLAAFGGDAPVQAIIPHLAGFMFVSILAHGRGDTAGAIEMGAAVAFFLLCVRALRRSRLRWVRGEANRGALALVASGAIILVVAGIIGTIVAPALPGSNSQGLVDLRSFGRQSERKLASPIISVQNLLTQQSNEVMFTVDSPGRHYWRLTALEQPIGFKWSSADSNYTDIDQSQDIASPLVDGVLGDSSDARIHITAMGGIWLPAPYAPRKIQGGDEYRFNDASSSLILSTDGSDLPAIDYTITATPPVVADLADLQAVAAQGGGPDSVDGRFMSIPGDTPSSLVDTARTVAGGSESSLEKAIDLQNYFRDNFTYDKSVDYSGTDDPFGAFLNAKRGFCQQFSTTFALMARVVGIPSRVAVGYTYGEPDNADAPTTWTVRGRHAHAWPELFIAGVGWLPFEPTPGRGNPDAPYTKVDAAQDDTTGVVPGGGTGAGNTTTTTTTTTTTPNQSPVVSVAPTTTTPRQRTTPQLSAPAQESSTLGTVGKIALWVLLGLAVLALAMLLFRWIAYGRRRRRRRVELGTGAAGAIRLAFHDVSDALGHIGLPRRPSETPLEYGARVTTDARVVGEDGLGDDLVEPIRRLAGLETERTYAPDLPDADDEAFATELAADVVHRVEVHRGRRARMSASLKG